jgi:hypothetical protein
MYIYNFKKIYKDKPLALDYGEWTKNVDIMKKNNILFIKQLLTQANLFLPLQKNGPTISQSILPTIITIWVTCFRALFNAFHV